MPKMKLGILYKNNKIVNHRSFVKVVLNPVFGKFGFQIGTMYDSDTEKLGGIKFMRCERHGKIEWDFNNHNDFDCIIKKRRII